MYKLLWPILLLIQDLVGINSEILQLGNLLSDHIYAMKISMNVISNLQVLAKIIMMEDM